MKRQNQQPQRPSVSKRLPGYPMDDNSSPAASEPIVPRAQTWRPKRHRIRIFFILFLLPTILVAINAIFVPGLFSNTVGSDSSTAFGARGPFVKTPLDAAQINAIMHLTGYMIYKQLASLYVSHMTLDEELGQLFMVQSYDQFYSPALEYMITQLHA